MNKYFCYLYFPVFTKTKNMKTFRTTGLICLLAALSISANSQPVRTQNQALIGFTLSCMNNDIIVGNITYDKVSWTGQKPDNSRMQIRLNDAIITGRTSNLTYTLNFAPYNLSEGEDGGRVDRMMTVKLEGRLVARLPVRILLQPDGEIIFDINPLEAKCF